MTVLYQATSGDKRKLHYCAACSQKINNGKQLSTEQIIEAVCKYFDIPVAIAKKKSRQQGIVDCRYFCMFFIRRHTRLYLKDISDIFDMHYSTAIHGIQKLNDWLHVEQEIKYHYAELNSILSGLNN